MSAPCLRISSSWSAPSPCPRPASPCRSFPFPKPATSRLLTWISTASPIRRPAMAEEPANEVAILQAVAAHQDPALHHGRHYRPVRLHRRDRPPQHQPDHGRQPATGTPHQLPDLHLALERPVRSALHRQPHHQQYLRAQLGTYVLSVYRGHNGPVVVFEEGENSGLPLEYLSLGAAGGLAPILNDP